MPKTVDVEGAGPVEFPDEFSDDQIRVLLERDFGPNSDFRKVKTSALGAGLRAGGESVLPSVGAAIGGGLLAGEMNPLAHVAPPWSEIGFGFGGAIAGGLAAEKGQKMIAKATVPEKLMKQYEALRQADVAQHNIAEPLGEFGGALTTFEFNPGATVRGLSAAAKLARGVVPEAEKAASMSQALGSATQLGLGAAQGVISPLMEGQSPTLGGVAKSAITMGLLGKSRGWVPGVPGEPAVPRPPATPEQRAAREPALLEEAKKMGVKATLMDTRFPESERKVAQGSKGEITISRPAFHQALDQELAAGVPEAEAIQKIVQHEAIHSATKILEGGDDLAKGYWNDLTSLEKNLMGRIYLGRKPSEPGPDLDRYNQRLANETNMGHEAIRFQLERLSGNPTEFINGSPKEIRTSRNLARIMDIVGWIREKMGTKASKRQLDLLDRVTANIEAIKKGTYAGSQQKTAEVHGLVQPPSGKGQGQVPTKEGSQRVLVPPEEVAQGTQVPLKKPGRVDPTERHGTPDEGIWFGDPKRAFPGERIIEAAYAHDDAIYYGPHHPKAVEKAGVEAGKYEERESRNTPRFGYRTSRRPFVTRDLAATIAKLSKQDLGQFEGPIHSDDVAGPGGKPISEQKDLNTPPHKLKALPVTQSQGAPAPVPRRVKGAAAAVSKPTTAGPPISTPTPVQSKAQGLSPEEAAYQNHMAETLELKKAGKKLTLAHLNKGRLLKMAAQSNRDATISPSMEMKPREEPENVVKRVAAMSPDEFAKETIGFRGKYGGNLTGMANEIGAGLKSKEEASVFANASKDIEKVIAEAKAKKDFGTWASAANKKQFFNEIYEAATGVKPDGSPSGSTSLIRHYDPNYVPPLAEQPQMAMKPREETEQDRIKRGIMVSLGQGVEISDPWLDKVSEYIASGKGPEEREQRMQTALTEMRKMQNEAAANLGGMRTSADVAKAMREMAGKEPEVVDMVMGYLRQAPAGPVNVDAELVRAKAELETATKAGNPLAMQMAKIGVAKAEEEAAKRGGSAVEVAGEKGKRKILPTAGRVGKENVAGLAEPGWSAIKPLFKKPELSDLINRLNSPEMITSGLGVHPEVVRELYDQTVPTFLHYAPSKRIEELCRAYRIPWALARKGGKGEPDEPSRIAEPDPVSLLPFTTKEGKVRWSKERQEQLKKYAEVQGVDTSKPNWKDALLLDLGLKRNQLMLEASEARRTKGLTDKQADKYRDEAIARQAQRQLFRAKVEAELAQKMVTQRADPRSPLRNELVVNDLSTDPKAKLAPYFEFTPKEGKRPETLRTWLTERSGTGRPETKSVVVLADDKTKDWHAVSCYMEPTSKEVLIYDPKSKQGDRSKNHIPLEKILAGYTVKARVLLDDPVNRFHQLWTKTITKSAEQNFMDSFGRDAKAASGGGRSRRDLKEHIEALQRASARRAQRERYALTEDERKVKEQLEGDELTLNDKDKDMLDFLRRVDTLSEDTKEAEEKSDEDESGESDKELLDSVHNLDDARQRLERVKLFYESEEPETGAESQLKKIAAAHASETIKNFAAAGVAEIKDPLTRMDSRSFMEAIHNLGFLREPIYHHEIDALANLFNDYEITPQSFELIIDQITGDAKVPILETIRETPTDPVTQLQNLGLRPDHYCVLSAIDKIVKQWQDKFNEAEDKQVHLLQYAADHNIPITKAKRPFYKEQQLMALDYAMNSIYDIAQKSKRTDAPKGVAPYNVELFRQQILSEYGFKTREGLESLAQQKKLESQRGEERLADIGRIREAGARPAEFEEPVIPLSRAGRAISKRIEGSGTLRGIAAPEFGRQVPRGYVPPQPARGGAPGKLGGTEQMLLRQQLASKYPAPTRNITTPTMGERIKGGKGARALSYIPPEHAGEFLRRTSEAQTGRKPFIPRGPEQLMHHKEPGEKPAFEMKPDDRGMAQRYREDLAQKGFAVLKVGGEDEVVEAQTMTPRQMNEEGKRLVLEEGWNAEQIMDHQEQIPADQRKINWRMGAVFRDHDMDLYRMADDIAKEKGLGEEYKQALEHEAEWAARVKAMYASPASEDLRLMQGVESLEDGSFTLLRNEARKWGETTDEEDISLWDMAHGMEAANGEVKVAIEKVGKVINKPPDLDEIQNQDVQAVLDQGKDLLRRLEEEDERQNPPNASMAMKGGEGGKAPLTEQKKNLFVAKGANFMKNMSVNEGGWDEASWKEAMLKKYGEQISGHLDEILPLSEKYVNAEILHVLGLEKATDPAKMRLTLRKSSVEVSRAIIANAQKMDPKGRKPSIPEAFHLWNFIKQSYLKPTDPKLTFDELMQKASQDLGMDPDRIYRALSVNKSFRKTTEEMYYKMRSQREVLTMAKNWVRNREFPKMTRIARYVPRWAFIDKILGHGFVPMITHAPSMMFNPYAWKPYFKAWGQMYKMADLFHPKEAELYHERLMQNLQVREHFQMWRTVRLECDPVKYSDDYSIAMMNKGLRRFLGGHGFDALKTLRYDFAETTWKGLPEHLKTTAMAKLIANSVNHATGIVNTPFPEFANWTFFAPKLEASRWAFLFGDPYKAISYLSKGKNITPVERQWAVSELKQKAAIVGGYALLLAANKGFLAATGSDQDINWTNPRKSDFWSFKVAGYKVGLAGPMIGMVRILADMLHIGRGDRSRFEQMESRQSRLGSRIAQYARGKLSPFASLGVDVATGEDYSGRPLPWSRDTIPRYKRLQGVEPYTPTEWGLATASPIPAEEFVKQVWSGMGMSGGQISKLLRPLISAGAMAATGVHVTEDPNAGN